MTQRWYRAVLDRVAPRAKLLDVGIGTGGALAANADVVREKGIAVTGVEIDPDYVKQCQQKLAKKGLDDVVDVRLESIYDHHGGPYDAVYFSASFMLMPDPERALKHVMRLLRPGGRVFFTQTFHEKKNAVAEIAKPLLVKVTTVDFGRVTYEADFLRIADEAGMEVLENTALKQGRAQSSRLVVGRPREAAVVG